jgi:hypothetical protein
MELDRKLHFFATSLRDGENPDESTRACTMEVTNGKIRFQWLADERSPPDEPWRPGHEYHEASVETFYLRYDGYKVHSDSNSQYFPRRHFEGEVNEGGPPRTSVHSQGFKLGDDRFAQIAEIRSVPSYSRIEWLTNRNHAVRMRIFHKPTNGIIQEELEHAWNAGNDHPAAVLSNMQKSTIEQLRLFLDENVSRNLLKITESSKNNLAITYSVVQSANPDHSFHPTTENPDPSEAPVRGGGFWKEEFNRERVGENPSKPIKTSSIQPNIYSIKYSS